MGLFTVNNQQVPQRAALENQYNSARFSLILMAICTTANVLLSLFQGGMYLLFSASIPFCLADNGAFQIGLYPDEYYEGILTMPSIGYVFIALALIIVALYFVFWVLSKKHVGWMIAALVMFIIDSIAMFRLHVIDARIALNIIFHLWVIVSLVIGIVAYFKLKKLPEEQPSPFIFNTEPNPFAGQTSGETESTSDEAPVEAAAETAVDETSTEEVSADVTEDSANEVE